MVQPVHLHQHTRTARARKSAYMVSVLPNLGAALLPSLLLSLLLVVVVLLSLLFSCIVIISMSIIIIIVIIVVSSLPRLRGDRAHVPPLLPRGAGYLS